ncbi:hypothetical protein ABK905_00030 [Acerihabitans sp. KWT182]|uniref:WH2 domain-containing protein n=1 Tax=Acerihabitans sp. KWT182 TaxID=3157919 RepID=A0AAU7Q9R0_9GAMM
MPPLSSIASAQFEGGASTGDIFSGDPENTFLRQIQNFNKESLHPVKPKTSVGEIQKQKLLSLDNGSLIPPPPPKSAGLNVDTINSDTGKKTDSVRSLSTGDLIFDAIRSRREAIDGSPNDEPAVDSPVTDEEWND